MKLQATKQAVTYDNQPMHIKFRLSTAAVFLVMLVCSASVLSAGEKPPRLILQITVDALRGDLPYRFSNVLGEGGFRYLMEQGVNYTNAHYQHANTETIHFSGRSKIFAVSVKDRGAVSLAGHAGKAFWFSKQNGEFVSSTYYYQKYPDWVKEWNARKPPSCCVACLNSLNGLLTESRQFR